VHYLTRFTESSSARIRAIVEMYWGVIGSWIHLIASACYPFPEVMKALAEPMSVFPVEGLPGDRYFPGTQVMDAIENTAEDLLRQLFSLTDDYRSTIQPHSGTQANQIVFNAVLKPDDVVLSLKPTDGGHISHTVLIGRRNRVISYPLGEDAAIDYERMEELAQKDRPRLIIAGGSACPREIDFTKIGLIARRVGAHFHADVSHTATFIAAGVHTSVFPHADFVTFNMSKNMRGPNGGVLIYRHSHYREVKKAIFPDTQGGPNENTMFAKLVTLDKLLKIDLRAYAERMIQIARLIAVILSDRGLELVTGGTDSHQVLIDLRKSSLSGIAAERVCEQYRVLVNRNLVTGDLQKPWITSGVRLGTSCITILDYSDKDVVRLAHWIADRLTEVESPDPVSLIDELTEKYNRKLIPCVRPQAKGS
jgi:glycine hydroxymethyltransferase